MTMRILLWSLTIWRTEAQQTSAGTTFTWDMNRKAFCLTPLMRDPLHPKWHGLSVEKQHAWVHVHRNRLSAIPQHLHLERKKKKKKAFHTVKDESFLCSYAALLLQFTWKELTGKGLAGVLTAVAFGGVGSGGGGFCCTARLWLVIASCKAFNTCKVRKNIN